MLIRNVILGLRWGVVIGAIVLFMILILTLVSDRVLSRTLTREDVEQKLSEHSPSKSQFYTLEHDWRSRARDPKPIATVRFWDTNFYMLDREYEVRADPATSSDSNVIDQERE